MSSITEPDREAVGCTNGPESEGEVDGMDGLELKRTPEGWRNEGGSAGPSSSWSRTGHLSCPLVSFRFLSCPPVPQFLALSCPPWR